MDPHGSMRETETVVRAAAVSLLCVALAVCVGYLVGTGWLLPAAGGAALLAAAFVAFRWPVLSAMVVLLISGGYSIFAMTPGWDIKGTTVGGGVRLEDVFMVGMLAASVIRIVAPEGRRRLGRLMVPVVLLAAWLAFETLRNAGSHGLSAPGELRFFYLLLAVGVCLVVSLERDTQVETALKGFVLISVALPLMLLPAVLLLKGWSFGPTARIFPSQVSLGLFLGLIVLWQGRRLVRWPRWAVYSATLVSSVVILLDAERVVWLSAVVVLALLALRQSFVAKVRWIFLALLLAVVVIFVAQGLGHDAVGVVVTRGGAVLAQEDTTGLRVSLWKAALPLVRESPILGRGLGMYWDLYLPQYGYTVREFPHSLYVMMLVNLGVVGVALFAWLWIRAVRVLTRVLRTPRVAHERNGRHAACAVLGLASLGALVAYGVAYGFEIYSVTLAGICLAGATMSSGGAVDDEAGGYWAG